MKNKKGLGTGCGDEKIVITVLYYWGGFGEVMMRCLVPRSRLLPYLRHRYSKVLYYLMSDDTVTS